ncbi:mammalian cell entry protein [Mycolicibacterium duvalii]|uniref:Mce family protein Mce3B n=1 Tax=Mycolicibacterium duvalii TaxID=39688 RepID=A0A7I7K5N3_9MYCO|nr:MCE family protein [Mycolicibacterium duvalii]MCV7365954.1 MCE family protein [Mycolicibacterium duvalii]PEG34526.1 mammalian cell entry protein [Mycolicibacterium duvalii]BBX19395.1 Mce family protein Mce3B [Mycolicibacterium duvalii]
MRENLTGAIWRVGVFLTVCALGLALMLAVFAQLRFEAEQTYTAEFRTVSGLEDGNFVRIAGVEVGKVKNIRIRDDGVALVEFGADSTVVLTEGSRAVIRYRNLIGERYLALEEGAGGTRVLPPDATIPLSRTAPALDLDALLGGFRPLFRALDPEQVNALSGQLIEALQGEGTTITTFLAQTAQLTGKLAERDQLIGQVITNLATVVGTLGDNSAQLAATVDALSASLRTMADRRQDLRNGLVHARDAAASVTDLLAQARAPFRTVVGEADRTATAILSDREYFERFLATLPEAYRMLNRQGLYGDFFSFYLCDLILKLNGKGGQPVYVKVAGQSSGRCTPR